MIVLRSSVNPPPCFDEDHTGRSTMDLSMLLRRCGVGHHYCGSFFVVIFLDLDTQY